MIQWDARGVKGVLDHYEVSLHKKDAGWMALVWVRKTHIKTINDLPTQELAQDIASDYLEKLSDETEEYMEKIGYFDAEPHLEDAED